jgi:hypothetical protein
MRVCVGERERERERDREGKSLERPAASLGWRSKPWRCVFPRHPLPPLSPRNTLLFLKILVWARNRFIARLMLTGHWGVCWQPWRELLQLDGKFDVRSLTCKMSGRKKGERGEKKKKNPSCQGPSEPRPRIAGVAAPPSPTLVQYLAREIDPNRQVDRLQGRSPSALRAGPRVSEVQPIQLHVSERSLTITATS